MAAMVTITHAHPFGFFKISLRQVSLSAPASSRVLHCFTSRRRLSFYSCSSCRFDTLVSRCSITDTNVQFKQVATEDEPPEDFAAVESKCSVPIVNLKSEILETKPLDLLTEETYVDSLLTKLPVLSEEEQNALAATPAHPAGLYALYASCAAGNLVEQLWNFAWPSAIALLHPSLLPVAVIGFFTKLVIIGWKACGSFSPSTCIYLYECCPVSRNK